MTKIVDDATSMSMYERMLMYSLIITTGVGRSRRKASTKDTMKQFAIEHIGVIVQEPVNMAQWYKDVLGFHITLSSEHDHAGKSVAFVTDARDTVMLELGKLPGISPISSQLTHHLQWHIAVESDNTDKDAEYLCENGAEYIEKCPMTMPGDELIVVKDPWNNCIQRVKRQKNIRDKT